MLPCSTSHVIAKKMGKIFEMTAAVPESICNRPIWVPRGLRHARAWLTWGPLRRAQVPLRRLRPVCRFAESLSSGPGSQRTTGVISDSTALIAGRLLPT
jgi:hypothetical protein